MKYDFDRTVNRKGTDCLKWDSLEAFNKPADTVPVWVADMDFTCPEEVIGAARKITERGIFGYSRVPGDYFDILQKRLTDKFGFTPSKEMWVQYYAVVPAIAQAILTLTNAGDNVLLMSPVYHNFTETIKNAGRNDIRTSFTENNGKWEIDFADFESKIIGYGIKVFVLCSPHNPLSRVFTKEELLRMTEICRKHRTVIISDEIHSELVLGDKKHFMLPAVTDYGKIILCYAPGKTFNLAGLQIADIIIPDPELKKQFKSKLDEGGWWMPNLYALELARAAYLHGDDWLGQLKVYLRGNIEFISRFVKEKMPKAKLTPPEATYLAWLDIRAYGYSGAELENILVNKAKVWVNKGNSFGKEGEGFIRINFATQRAVLEKALERIAAALE